MTAARTLRSPSALADAGLISPDRIARLQGVAAQYAVAITPAIADLIDRSDPSDPIARQFVPDPAECEDQPDERDDPIGDDRHSPLEGVVHRYPDRVLLKVIHVCPVYCRFCFRREMVGPGGRRTLSRTALDAAYTYIRDRREIWEVILTGGDPLIVSPRRLRAVVRALSAIDHVRVLRLHTRVPIAAPERVTRDVVRALKADGKATYVVLHANHPRELTSDAIAACARFIDAGIPMLSQTVLLRGVNDEADVLGDLLRRLVENRIKPYYLHQADLAPGTSHLRTSIAKGQDVMRALRGRMSGLCQPTYVLDIPGGFGKVPVGPRYLSSRDDGNPGRYQIEDTEGRQHAYPPESCAAVEEV
jgi:lysine 2,3-aminomutase